MGVNNYQEYLRKKKLPITKGYFYTYLVLLLLIILTVSIGVATDITLNMPTQIAYRKQVLDVGSLTESEIASDLRTAQIIKFGSIAFGSMALCLMTWLGRRKIEYGFVFNVLWIMVFAILGFFPYYGEIKALANDIIVLTLSIVLIIFLISWGIGLNIHRKQLKINLKQAKTIDL